MNKTLTLSALLGVALSVMSAGAAKAADNLTLINGALNVSVPYTQLKTLAETGVADGNLVLVLDDADETPEAARKFLTTQMDYDIASADALLNSAEGDAMLTKLGKVIAPRNANEDGKQALRAAILKSLMDDNTITPLEIIANYPTDARIDVIRLRESGASHAGLSEVVSMMQSKRAMSKAAMATEEIETRFADREGRISARMQAMWAGVGVPERGVAIQSEGPVRGLW